MEVNCNEGCKRLSWALENKHQQRERERERDNRFEYCIEHAGSKNLLSKSYVVEQEPTFKAFRDFEVSVNALGGYSIATLPFLVLTVD